MDGLELTRHRQRGGRRTSRFTLAKDSDILVDQVLAWDNYLFRTDLGPLPEALQAEVRRALLEFLDLV